MWIGLSFTEGLYQEPYSVSGSQLSQTLPCADAQRWVGHRSESRENSRVQDSSQTISEMLGEITFQNLLSHRNKNETSECLPQCSNY